MKIAQIVSLEESVPPQSKNGLEFVVSWLTEELVKRGHDVTLFAPANSKTKARLISLFPKGTSNNLEMVWGWDSRNFSDWNISLALSKQKEFDVIHVHTGNVVKFLSFIQKPVVYTKHGPYNNEFRKKYLDIKKYQKYFKFVLKQYKKINYVTISKFQQKSYKKCQLYYFKKFTNIYNGIPLEKFTFNDNPEEYLLFLGYLSENKGPHIAIKVARKLKKKLIIAGEYCKKEPSYFNKQIKPCLNKDIKYVGPVNFKEKNELLKNARALLNPVTWDEPFGLVPVEAQACGTPVVAFRRGAIPEVIKNNKTGFVVENEKEMIQAIKKIETVNRADCRRWVEENFTVKRMVDEYEKLYKRLIKD